MRIRQGRRSACRQPAFLAACALTLLSTSGSGYAAGSLCRSAEQALFSCRIGRNIASICASGNSTGSGSLQYRYGPPGAPQLRLPAAADHWRQMAASHTFTLIGGGGAYVAFASAPYRYVVYTSISHGREKAGVAVERNGRLIRNLRCSTRATSVLGPNLFSQYGFTEDTKGFDLP